MGGSIRDLGEGLRAGDLSPVFLAHHGLERMRVLEGRLNAIVHTNPELTLQAAQAAEARLRAGEGGPLLGIPVLFKDNLAWRGTPVTNGSRVSQGYVAPFHATVVQRLLDAGAVPLGRTNMDEFAMGSSGEHSAFGPTRNPWDTGRVPGGSSSGSAAAVAARYAPLALGSDTGGSVRLPAAFCGVTGFRPTYGVLSRYGLTAMASSLDQVGPLATTAEDVAAALSVLAGQDPLDATSRELPSAERLHPLQPADLRGLRVGIPREYFGDGLSTGVRARVEAALAVLEGQGACCVDLSLPHTDLAIDVYYLLNTAEVSSNLSRFDGLRFGLAEQGEGFHGTLAATRSRGFGLEVKRRILLGAFGLSRGYYEAFYDRAQRARRLIQQDFEAAFLEVDVIATPVAPEVAFPLGARLENPLAMYLADLYTVTAALAGLPAIALPAGLADGLPVGVQLMGRPLEDVRLLEVAHAFQQVTDHHRQAPDL